MSFKFLFYRTLSLYIKKPPSWVVVCRFVDCHTVSNTPVSFRISLTNPSRYTRGSITNSRPFNSVRFLLLTSTLTSFLTVSVTILDSTVVFSGVTVGVTFFAVALRVLLLRGVVEVLRGVDRSARGGGAQRDAPRHRAEARLGDRRRVGRVPLSVQDTVPECDLRHHRLPRVVSVFSDLSDGRVP